ncbi:hypothetical protein FVER14953_20345 [Fusarium verticillioides]|nr:hypothetical protein FVER14953_20345 [Fusarium verticillioides]
MLSKNRIFCNASMSRNSAAFTALSTTWWGKAGTLQFILDYNRLFENRECLANLPSVRDPHQ